MATAKKAEVSAEARVVGYVVKVHGKYLGQFGGHAWMAYKRLSGARKAATTVQGSIHAVRQVVRSMAGEPMFSDCHVDAAVFTPPERKARKRKG